MFHIVFLSPHSDPEARLGEVDSGGQCVYELQLAKYLSMIDGVKVTVYCRKKFDYPYISHINDRFSIKRISCGGDDFIPKEELAPVLDEFSKKVADDLKRNPPSVVCGHYWDGGAATLYLYKYLPEEFPMVWTPHSLGVAKRRRFLGIDSEMVYKFVPRISWENYTTLLSDLIILSTQDEADNVIQDYQVEEDKIKIIPIGIDTSDFKPIDKIEARKLYDLPLDKPLVMTLGRMDKRKGYHNCIRVFAEYKKRFNNNLNLAIFSGNAQSLTVEETIYLQELKALTEELGVTDSVYFRDAVTHDQVYTLYALADAYLCLSENEPFGITILEGMYAKVPVISTINGGPRNILTNNITGILVDPHDYRRAAFDLRSIIKDPENTKKIVSKARRLIDRKYTWEARAKEFHEAYKNLVKHSSGLSKRDFLRHIGIV